MLTRGHIFINTSLTEAYCMAIVEAASCGLQVVSTRVGGIPEVLPSSLIILTEPTVESVLDGVHRAIEKVIVNISLAKLDPNEKTNDLKRVHSTQNGQCNGGGGDTAKRKKKQQQQVSKEITADDIEQSSDRVLCPFECNQIVGRLYNWDNVSVRTELVYQRVMTEADPSFGDKLNCYYAACVPFMLVVSFSYLMLKVLDYIYPKKYIDVTPDFTMPETSKMNQR